MGIGKSGKLNINDVAPVLSKFKARAKPRGRKVHHQMALRSRDSGERGFDP